MRGGNHCSVPAQLKTDIVQNPHWNTRSFMSLMLLGFTEQSIWNELDWKRQILKHSINTEKAQSPEEPGACAVPCPWSTRDGWWQHKGLCLFIFEFHFRFSLVPADQNHSSLKHMHPPEILILILFYPRTNLVWHSKTTSQNARENRN